MKPKYRTSLYDADGKVIMTLVDCELKKDAEELLDATVVDYAYAMIAPVYVKGGEAVGG